MHFRHHLFLLVAFAALVTMTIIAGPSRTSEAAIAVPEQIGQRYAKCPVTKAPEPQFIPPEPWPAEPPGEHQFWYGSAALWTALPDDGSWAQLAHGEKFWMWSAAFDVSEDSTPDVVVSAKPVHGSAATFQVSGATNAYHESFHWAMLTGVELPAPGCWAFTIEYKGHELSFVIWVPNE